MRLLVVNMLNVFFFVVYYGIQCNTVGTTFSPKDNVLVLWDIASANGTMMVENVVEAWSVASLGLREGCSLIIIQTIVCLCLPFFNRLSVVMTNLFGVIFTLTTRNYAHVSASSPN